MQQHNFDLANILDFLHKTDKIKTEHLIENSKKVNYDNTIIWKNHELLSVITTFEPPFYTHRYLQPTEYLDYFNYLHHYQVNLDKVVPFLAKRLPSDGAKMKGKYGVIKEQIMMGNTQNDERFESGSDGLYAELKYVKLSYLKKDKNKFPNGKIGTLRIGDLMEDEKVINDLNQPDFFKTSIFEKLEHLLLGTRNGPYPVEMYYLGPDFWNVWKSTIDNDWASIKNGYNNRKTIKNIHTSIGKCISIKQQAGGNKKTGKTVIKPFIIIQDHFLNNHVINNTHQTILTATSRPRIICKQNMKYTHNLTPTPEGHKIVEAIW